jgi:quercetin dioxygenase-like cupin family protein
VAAPFSRLEDREPFPIFPGVELRAFGGEQVLLCHVRYAPGTTVARHAHEHTEQIVAIVEGSLSMRVGDETRELSVGDAVVINRGIEHELHSAEGCTFFEALSPVPLDHVPDPERDLVLGERGGALHVER